MAKWCGCHFTETGHSAR